MKNVCIILPKGLPVPSVKGGAIETLMNDIIDENEKQQKLYITICSIYDEEAFKVSKKYKKTNFVFIRKNIKYYLKAIKVRLLNIFSKKCLYNTYIEMVLDEIKNQKFDRIVVENAHFSCFNSYLKYFNTDQMYVHFHHVGESNKYVDTTFGHFIGVSDFVTKNFSKTSKIEDCITLKNGIDVEKFKCEFSDNNRTELRRKFGVKNDDFLVVYCGRLVPQKGVLELIHAVKKINNDKIKLMIVGSINFKQNATSEYLMQIKNEVETSNGKIFMTGFIDNADVYKYYKSGDVAVVPSVYEDAAPLTVIEIMASGLPLIVTRTGGAPEYASSSSIIIEKDESIVDNIKEKIIYLYKNPEIRKEMSLSGKETAMNYSTSHFYNDFVDILK